MTKYFVNDKGEYLGGFDCDPEFYPVGQEVKTAPENAADIWNGKEWVRNLEQRNAAIKAQRQVAFADIFTGSDGMFIKADAMAKMGLDNTQAVADAVARRQAIIDSLPYEVE